LLPTTQMSSQQVVTREVTSIKH